MQNKKNNKSTKQQSDINSNKNSQQFDSRQQYQIKPILWQHKRPQIRSLPSQLFIIFIEDFHFLLQTRTNNQIALTDRLAISLTQLNLKRIIAQNNHYELFNHQQKQKQKWIKNVQFVCIHGIPSKQQQFDFINLPIKSSQDLIHFYPSCFNPNLKTQQQKINQYQNSSYQDQAKILFKKLNKNQTINKKIVFIFHSFGAYNLHTLFHYYSQIKTRTIGYIDIGGPPVKLYPLIIQRIIQLNLLKATKQFLLENSDQVHSFVVNSMNAEKQQATNKKDGLKRKAVFEPYEHKYQSIGMCHMIISSDFKIMFKNIRQNSPKILKLLIHGREDDVFQSYLMNEKIIFFSYSQQKNEYYERILKNVVKRYNIYNGNDIIQSRFAFSLQNGKHSVHMQRKMKQTIKNSIHEYLFVIMKVEQSKQNKQNLNKGAL